MCSLAEVMPCLAKAFLHLDLAAAADAAPAADAFDMHAQLPRGIEHRRVCRESGRACPRA
jgi:hypothetical protein